MSKGTQRVFLVRAGGDGKDEAFALEKGYAIIGFSEYPSLEKAADYSAIYELIKNATPELRPRAIGNYAGQLWAFALSMKEGDIVVLPRKGTSQIALGIVKGPYTQKTVAGVPRHVRKVQWVRPDVSRSVFGQDLLYSFGAFMTVCNIQRNDAARRVKAILDGKPDPGVGGVNGKTVEPSITASDEQVLQPDLALAAHDQIVAHIQSRFTGHQLAELVGAVLAADGWVAKLSPPGPDGGVDILCGRGPLGLDAPRLCVQVKSQNSSADVNVYRNLQGTMQTFKADQGLLVCWGGFNKVVMKESKQGHFTVRLWDSRDLVEAIYRTYEKLPAEIQAELPLKHVWMLVKEDGVEQ